MNITLILFSFLPMLLLQENSCIRTNHILSDILCNDYCIFILQILKLILFLLFHNYVMSDPKEIGCLVSTMYILTTSVLYSRYIYNDKCYFLKNKENC